MTQEELNDRAARLGDAIIDILPEAEYVHIIVGDLGAELEFYDSKRKVNILDSLRFVTNKMERELAEESARNN